LIGGLIFDYFGTYAVLLMLAIPACLVAASLVAWLGPYPEFQELPSSSATSPRVGAAAGQIS
jgi:hypothetical protein